jgi:hypothetical protein
MRLRSPKSRRVLTAVAVIITIAAATVVWQNLPTPPDITGPFDVHGDAGLRTAGRDIAATVTGTRIAPEVDSVPAAGIWVVVDATLEAPRSTELPKSDLIIGPNRYTPTDRFFLKTLQADVSPGISLRGSWVFDVAADLVAPGGTEPLTLRVWTGYDDQLDSRLVIEIPAGDVSRSDSVTLEVPAESAT